MLKNIIINGYDYNKMKDIFQEKIINNGNDSFYSNTYYLCLFNNNPIAVYRNTKGYFHIIMLEKRKFQDDYLLGKNELKFSKSLWRTTKEIIDNAHNKDEYVEFAEGLKTNDIKLEEIKL